MATFANSLQQATNEIHTYTVDYTDDLPAGVTVTGGTATHTPPSGSASTITTSISSPYVLSTLPAQAVAGIHYLDILATFSNGDKSSVRVPINIVYPSALSRTGMSDIISDLRGMTDANVDDYTVSGVPYWSDAQMQRILDNHRTELKWVEMTAEEEGDGTWVNYVIGYGNLEQTTGGTAIFIVQDVNGASVDQSEYSVDYMRGVVTFNADTGGTPYWVTARSFDLEGAAAEVWRRKQSHYAAAVNFSTKVHNISRSQLYDHAKEMAELYESKGDAGFGTVDVVRSDTDW